MQDVLRRLVGGARLTESEAESAFERILTGGADEAQIGAMLALIRSRGATTDELVGAARAMRRFVTRVPTEGLEEIGVLIDTCGTGGAAKTFNVSTVAAIIAAAARGERRVIVAKHGSRSRTGRGSAEVLERLGVNVAAGTDAQRKCLEEIGVCFCFAIHHHPAMRYAAGPRASLGFPSIFNLVGPLTNPAMAPRQLMGVYDAALVEQIAEAHLRLGAERAMVVHGLDGLDELTTTSANRIADVRGGTVEIRTYDAASDGVARASLEDLQQATDLGEAADL
ncbi:MAG: anthranilate phosphoribosyltransferase, partial [Planctomycetota bacterium]|nr:anthranilate phosphoribosyltransferase [Planctomycetota bacterium]